MSNIHSKCGGNIINNKCEKCGKTWGKVRSLFAGDIEPEPPKKFSEKDYRRRIRDGKDIWK